MTRFLQNGIQLLTLLRKGFLPSRLYTIQYTPAETVLKFLLHNDVTFFISHSYFATFLSIRAPKFIRKLIISIPTLRTSEHSETRKKLLAKSTTD